MFLSTVLLFSVQRQLRHCAPWAIEPCARLTGNPGFWSPEGSPPPPGRRSVLNARGAKRISAWSASSAESSWLSTVGAQGRGKKEKPQHGHYFSKEPLYTNFPVNSIVTPWKAKTLNHNSLESSVFSPMFTASGTTLGFIFLLRVMPGWTFHMNGREQNKVASDSESPIWEWVSVPLVTS